MKLEAFAGIIKAMWGKPAVLASMFYIAILPAVFMLFRLNEPELALWKLLGFLIWAFLMIRMALSREGGGRGRVNSAEFKQRLWPAFWRVQGLAIKLAFAFGVFVFAAFVFGRSALELGLYERLARAVLMIYLFYWVFVLQLMQKTASWPSKLFTPTLLGIWRLKWGREVLILMVIILIIVGAQLSFAEQSSLFKDSSWMDILFAVNFAGFVLILLMIAKGQPRSID